MADVDTVVIGETGVHFFYTFEDDDGPIDITGAQALRFQAISGAIAKELDVAGTVVDGPQGQAKWTALGGTDFLVGADLGELTEALFTCETKLIDAAGKVRFGKPRFPMLWMKSLLDQD